MSAVSRRRRAAVRLLTLLLIAGLAVAAAGCGRASARDTTEPTAASDVDVAAGRDADPAAARPDPTGTAGTGATATPDGPDSFQLSERDLRVPVTLPPDGTAEPYPLVIGLHSLFHDSSESRSQWGLEQLSAIAGFAVAYPDGLGLSWNAGTCCESAAATGVDDVGWLRSLISHLGANYPVDLRRVYLVGFSNGGMLAYRYACEYGDELAGIGVVAGSLQIADCEPPAPVTVVSVHGLADGHVPLAGIEWSEPLRTRISSTRESLTPFRAAAGCLYPDLPSDVMVTGADGLPPTSSAAAPAAAGAASGPVPELVTPPQAGQLPLAVRFESACTTDATVVEYQLPRLAHGWPPVFGPDAFDTVGALWRVLSQSRSATAVPLF